MVLALSLLLVLSFTAIPLIYRTNIRPKNHSIPVSQELQKPLVTPCGHHHPVLKSNSGHFNILLLKPKRRQPYPNNLRFYSVFAWVSKFEQEEQLHQTALQNLHLARVGAMRLLLLKAKVIFEVLKKEVKTRPISLTKENKNFLHIGQVHRLAQP